MGEEDYEHLGIHSTLLHIFCVKKHLKSVRKILCKSVSLGTHILVVIKYARESMLTQIYPLKFSRKSKSGYLQ